MSAIKAVTRLLRVIRPHSKFIAVKHSSEFLPKEAELGEGFFYANLYDESINANLNVTDHGDVLIENTYISSFAYNLFLCWLYCSEYKASPALRDSLLVHNLKKLCAEQLYRRQNTVSSRALLLETLLYEERRMVEVFATRETNPALEELARGAGFGVMNFLLTQHEFGHYIAKTKPLEWVKFLSSGPIAVKEILNNVEQKNSAEFLSELKCDLFAVYAVLHEKEKTQSVTFILRAISFAYAAYAAMYSLSATAEQTTDLWRPEIEDKTDLLDIAPWADNDVPVINARDAEFVARAEFVLKICEEIAKDRGLSLFGEEEPLPLPPTIVQDFLSLTLRVFDCEDENARRMSRLVAKAFDGHEDGMEYLYLRSKTFRTNRKEPLTL